MNTKKCTKRQFPLKCSSCLWSLILVIPFATLLITACVINTPIQNQANKNETLRNQVEAEKSQRHALETELKNLKARLKTFNTDLKALKKEAMKRSKNLKEELLSLDEVHAFTKKMRDQLEKTFNNTVTPLKKGS